MFSCYSTMLFNCLMRQVQSWMFLVKYFYLFLWWFYRASDAPKSGFLIACVVPATANDLFVICFVSHSIWRCRRIDWRANGKWVWFDHFVAIYWLVSEFEYGICAKTFWGYCRPLVWFWFQSNMRMRMLGDLSVIMNMLWLFTWFSQIKIILRNSSGNASFI